MSSERGTRADALASSGRGEREVAVRLRGISKVYPLLSKPSDRLKQFLVMGRKQYFDTVQALHDVDLEVYRGETVGIVGRNGSGKSTVLQIAAGLLRANAGTVETNGRVAALLELGAGFNPDFTGIENIRLNAAILGLTAEETEERMERVIEFSGLGRDVERPVSTYSSGMFVRLAFSVAISVDPDVLIVDEALAVGDEGFQRKCLARIDEMKNQGVAILFVSHAMSMINQLCDRAVLFDRGEVILDGSPRVVGSAYYKICNATKDEYERARAEILGMAADAAPQVATHSSELVSQSRVEYESQGARISDPRIETTDGERVNILARKRHYVLRYEVTFTDDAEQVRFATLFKTLQGVELGGRATHRSNDPMPDFEAGETVSVAFEFTCDFLSGTFFVNMGVNGLVDGERRSLHRILDGVMFQVVSDSDDSLTGLIELDIVPSVERAGKTLPFAEPASDAAPPAD
jgi:lipopolysaccharide transport system ATP-binding protein